MRSLAVQINLQPMLAARSAACCSCDALWTSAVGFLGAVKLGECALVLSHSARALEATHPEQLCPQMPLFCCPLRTPELPEAGVDHVTKSPCWLLTAEQQSSLREHERQRSLLNARVAADERSSRVQSAAAGSDAGRSLGARSGGAARRSSSQAAALDCLAATRSQHEALEQYARASSLSRASEASLRNASQGMAQHRATAETAAAAARRVSSVHCFATESGSTACADSLPDLASLTSRGASL